MHDVSAGSRRILRPARSRAVPVLLACAGLSACITVGPDYQAPQTATAPAWQAPLIAGLSGDSADARHLAVWWKTFDDPVLTGLIERAVGANLDLRQAQARLRESRARRGIADANRFPTLAASAAATRNRASGETGAGLTTELYSTGFDASWELDLFGGKRRAAQAARAELAAAEEDLYNTLVSLSAEVALNYVEIRAFQARLAIAGQNLTAQTETHEITRWRHQAGLTTQLDVDQAKLSLEQTRAQIPALRSGLAQARNRLAVLLGQAPGALKDGLDEPRAIPVAPAGVAVGVPAETLRRRPDVRRAERQLAAQTAQVGVATAARYPNFSLIGSIGLEAFSSAKLFQSSADTAVLGANAGWTLFDAGRLRQNVAVQNALQEQALIRYEAAVLTALRDVENALVAYAEEQARRQALADGAQAAHSAYTLAHQQYTAGMIDFQAVLDTQRSLLSLQDQLASSDAEVTSNLVRLYKALGGGWTPATPASSTSSTRTAP